MRNIETLLNRLRPEPQFEGNMIQDSYDMYMETGLCTTCTFHWTDVRAKPTWAELEAEYLIYLKEKKTSEVEASMDAALEDKTVSIDGVEVWDKATKAWVVQNGVEFIADTVVKSNLNRFKHKLIDIPSIEKKRKINGYFAKVNAALYDKIDDALDVKEDAIIDWAQDTIDEIYDAGETGTQAEKEAEIEAIVTTYPG